MLVGGQVVGVGDGDGVSVGVVVSVGVGHVGLVELDVGGEGGLDGVLGALPPESGGDVGVEPLDDVPPGEDPPVVDPPDGEPPAVDPPDGEPPGVNPPDGDPPGVVPGVEPGGVEPGGEDPGACEPGGFSNGCRARGVPGSAGGNAGFTPGFGLGNDGRIGIVTPGAPRA